MNLNLWETVDKWTPLTCDRCHKLMGYFKEDWTDGAGLTDSICPDCKTPNDNAYHDEVYQQQN